MSNYMKENIKDYLNIQDKDKDTQNKNNSKEKKKLKIDSGSFYPKSKRSFDRDKIITPSNPYTHEKIQSNFHQYYPMYYGNFIPGQTTPVMPYSNLNLNSQSLKFREENFSYKIPINKIKTDVTPFLPKNVNKEENKLKPQIVIEDKIQIENKNISLSSEDLHNKSSTISITKLNEFNPIKHESIKVKEILMDHNKKQSNNKYGIEYLLSMRKWKICKENSLIPKELINNWEKMKNNYEDVYSKDKREARSGYKNSKLYENRILEQKEAFQRSKFDIFKSPGIPEGLEKWGRKDLSGAEKEADIFRSKMNEEKSKDPIKFQLTELMNILTVDNYSDVKNSVFQIIKSDVGDQEKFIEVLFKKALTEKSFVTLYAKLCKDMDKELPQKISDKGIKPTSAFRSKLLEKAKSIFKFDNEKIDKYIKYTDPEEKEFQLKRFILGNTNFISELINYRILSKKVVFQCLNLLFQKIEKTENPLLLNLNIESIVILLDKFGTLINRIDEPYIDKDELLLYNKNITEYLNRLDKLSKTDNSLPKYIIYKIINLIEKKKRGWEESKVEKTLKVKSLKEARDEFEKEQLVVPGIRYSPRKLDKEEVKEKILSDLIEWREFCRKGNSKETYDWRITEDILSKNKISEVFQAFAENCIDFIGNKDDITYAYEYLYEFISYHKSLSQNDRKDVKEVTIYFLENLYDFSLDNTFLVDIWSGIIYLLLIYKIISFTDLNSLHNLNEEQINCIFDVLYKYMEYVDDKVSVIEELQNVDLIRNNISIFNKCIKL